jgi:tetratricopeptide (TPR) repeat protein
MNDASTASVADDTRLAVDALHPWLGLASYTEETRSYFYGREEEVAELCRRVQRKQLTILFGQSGLGKTSILRAGIVPRLRPEGYCPVYVRIDYSPDSPVPTEQIKQAIFRATQAAGAWTQPGTAVSGESLWEFLHHRDDVLRDASGKTLIPLLIFDQFEELFTLAQSDDFGRQRAAQFIEDLADLVENRAPKALEAKMDADESAVEEFDFTRSDYRILIALREDYLAHLEGLKGAMPSISQNRMRLARMTGAQALSAVVKPGGKLVSEEVAGSIVRFVAGGAELANAEVEPALLSLICRELNNARIAQGKPEISADLLAGSRDTILSEFYERALADQPAGVRQFIEDNLLTESGHRESLAEERVQKGLIAAGASANALFTLVDRRLLRIEERLDVRRVELTHDVLTGVVRASRDVRLEREARDEAERKLATQRERELATRKALVRARKIAAICGVLAIAAAASAVFGYLSMKRAQEAEAKADETRLMAEAARGESEKLVVFLLEDFYLELAPVGRLDVVGALAKRALDYYNALPEALRTTRTERNRAFALVRYGAVLRTQARLDEGNKAIDEAVQVLGKMHEQGDLSETTAIGLSLGLSTQARLASSVNLEGKALPISERAIETIKPLATAPNPTVSARRAYAEALIMQGYLQMSNEKFDEAIATLDVAKETLASIDKLSMNDLAAAAAYAEATGWQVQSLTNLGRGDEAKRSGKEGLAVAAQVLEKRPGHMQALRAQGLITSPLVSMLNDEMRLSESLAMSDTTLNAWREFVRMDPGNTISWSNLGVSRVNRNDTLQSMGRVTDAAANLRAGIDIDARAPPSPMMRWNISGMAGRLALLEADRGNRKQAEDALAENRRLVDWIVANTPPNTFMSALHVPESDVWRIGAAFNLGDYQRALEIGRTVVPKLEQLKPEDAGQKGLKKIFLRSSLFPMAQSAYMLKDYATAEKYMTQILELQKYQPRLTLGEMRISAFEQAYAALVLARLNRQADAQQLIVPALKVERELSPRNHDDPSQRLELATALFAAAVAGQGDPVAQLTEAADLIDRLPSEMRQLRSTSMIRNGIADEQKNTRK